MSNSFDNRVTSALVASIRASKELQSFFLIGQKFSPRALTEPFDVVQENLTLIATKRVSVEAPESSLYTDYVFGVSEAKPDYIIHFTRHKQRQRFSRYEFSGVQGTAKYPKKTQKFGYTYNFYAFPKEIVKQSTQWKDGFDLILDLDKAVSYLSSNFLDEAFRNS